MEVYRIHNQAFSALDGTGAAVRGARWNPVGSSIVYASATYEGAILEQLVHAGIGRLPRNRVVSRVAIPEDAPMDRVPEIPEEAWYDTAVTRGIGLEWLETRRSLVLMVPSAAARPFGRHALLNPAHPDFARVWVIDETPVTWDARLFGVRRPPPA